MIEEYKNNLESKRVKFQPENLKNEVAEYINQKLFVITKFLIKVKINKIFLFLLIEKIGHLHIPSI